MPLGGASIPNVNHLTWQKIIERTCFRRFIATGVLPHGLEAFWRAKFAIWRYEPVSQIAWWILIAEWLRRVSMEQASTHLNGDYLIFWLSGKSKMQLRNCWYPSWFTSTMANTWKPALPSSCSRFGMNFRGCPVSTEACHSGTSRKASVRLELWMT